MIRNIVRDIVQSPQRPFAYSNGEEGTTTIQSLFPEAEFQLLAKNYSGSGDFLNEIANPYSGASQSEYDFQLINSPTHSTDHFLLDGTNYFKVASNSDYIEDIHKDNGALDVTFAFIVDFTGASPNVSVMGTTDYPGANGFHLQGRTSGFNDISTRFLQGQLTLVNEFTTLDALVGGTQFIAYTVDGANQEAYGVIDNESELDTYSSTATTTAAANSVLHLGCSHNGSGASEIMVNGSKIFGAVCIAKACNTTEIASIRSWMEAEIGI